MDKIWAFSVIVALSMGVVCVCYADAPMGTLGAVFRRRLRDLLDRQRTPAGQLAVHLKVDAGRLSKILKYDAEAATVKLERLESIAEFFEEIPSNLVRIADDEPMVLSPIEAQLIGLVRLLPQPQKENLVTMLDYFFKPRREAQAEKRALKMLRESMERQLAEPPTRRDR